MEKLGTKSAVNELKTISSGSLSMGWGSQNIQYAEQEAIHGLGRAGEIGYLVGWLAKGLPYANYLTPIDVIRVIEQYGNIGVVPELEQVLSISTDEEIIGSLQRTIEVIASNAKSSQ